jgi:hypothetical protein
MSEDVAGDPSGGAASDGVEHHGIGAPQIG